MKRLEGYEYRKVVEHFTSNHIKCPTFASSVLYQVISGVVYVDDPELPNSILIGTSSGIYFIAGAENNSDFNRWFERFFYKRKQLAVRFTLFSYYKAWDKRIHELFNSDIHQMKRYSFCFNEERHILRNLTIPEGFKIKRSNEEYIMKSSDFNEAYYQEYWGSVSNFIKKGFGFCALYNGEIAGECTSIFLGGSLAEVDIITKEDFRGKGLAGVLGEAFIEECMNRNITPGWDCDVENTASIRLANKLGFHNPMEYTIFVKR